MLPPHAVVDGTLLDLECVGLVLQQALSRLGSSARYAAVAVAGPSVITRLIDMDAGLSDEEMAWKIQMEADQFIPYPLDEVAIDFQVQGAIGSRPAVGRGDVGVPARAGRSARGGFGHGGAGAASGRCRRVCIAAR